MKANMLQYNLFIKLDNTRIIKTIATIYKIIIIGRVQKNILSYFIQDLQGHLYKEIIGNSILSILNKIILNYSNFICLKEEVFPRQLGDGDVNDGFGTSHHYHQTTITNITKFLPSLIIFWVLMYKEFRALKYFGLYKKKLGANVVSKIDLLVKIFPLINHLLIAGKMARIGNSILDYYKKKSKVHSCLPIDVSIKEQFAKKKSKGWMGLDIGRKFIHEFITEINSYHGVFMIGGDSFVIRKIK